MVMNDYFIRVSKQTPTKFWINNVTINQAEMALHAGAVGCTQNPAYTWKILNSADKDAAVQILDEILKTEEDDNEALIKLQRALVERVAERFMPLYEASNGKYGYVSIQGDPFDESEESIIDCARFNRANYPNIMAKIPATVSGLRAIRVLLREGTPINATEVMALRQAVDVCNAYEEAAADSKNPPVVYYSHIAGIFDEHLKASAEKEQIDISSDALWQAGGIVAKKIYQITKTHWPEVGMISGGARGLHHFTEMVGADAAVTINWDGTADKLLEQNPPVVDRFCRPASHEVIDVLTEKMPDFKQAYCLHEIQPEEYEDFGPVVRFRRSFEEAWSHAREFIKKRRASI